MCEKQNVLPIGISEDLKIARVKVYCPRCKDIYSPKKKSADADGAFFGTSFPFLLLMVLQFPSRHIPISNHTLNAKNSSQKSLDSP
jgi:casein kinase II subunit beta